MDTLQDHLKTFEAACRKAGLKVTHQRLEVYRELLKANDHPTAETLHRRLRKKLPKISIDTVYRTLTTFANYGLINKVETVESLNRFEVTRSPHHHLICSQCRSIIDFTWPSIDEIPLPVEVEHWGKIDNRTVVVYGTCKRCLKE